MAVRFWAKVDVRGPDECWPWMASVNLGGYGQFQVATRTAGKAHRVAYELARGAIGDDLWVLHICDNPPCVNPAHLFLGTVQDNNADRDCKRRWASKLTDSDVATIRAATGVSQSDLASRYGVGQPTISRIRSGKRW